MKKSVLFIFICLLLCGCGKERVVIDDTNDFLTLNKTDIEVYSKVYLNDIINVVNEDVKIISDNYKIDTDKLGKKSVEVKYKFNDKTFLYKGSVNVKDTTKPFVFSGTYHYVDGNYDGNLCDLLLYGDNYTGNVKCEIEGNYDLKKEGEYNLNYKLSDESGNVTNESVTINVGNRPSSEDDNSYESTHTYFTDIYKKHKNDDTLLGVDISEWQENVDFKKLKNAGASFVMLRIGFQGIESKKLYEDATFKDYIKKAKDAGLMVGAYFYSVASSKKEAKEQAKYVIDILDKESLDLPIAFDWETWQNWNSYKISFHELGEIADTFISEVRKGGYKGSLYSSKYYLENIWMNEEDNDVWLAHYTDQTSYKGNYSMWQLCNDGVIDGINGNADFNVLYLKK